MQTEKATKPEEVFLKSMISAALIAITVGIVFLMARPKEKEVRADGPPAPLAVEVVPLIETREGIDIQTDGEVVPYRSVDIAPEVQGRVVYKSENCRLGRYVKKDELLLEIDNADYELEVRRITENVSQAKNSIKELEVQIENTNEELVISKDILDIRKREFERYSKSQPGTYSESEIDNARSSLLSAEDSVKKLENQVRLCTAQLSRLNNTLEQEKVALELAELNLKRTKIRSPIDGVVTEYSFEIDSYLQKGTKIVTIQDASKLEIQCSLHVRQMQWIWQTQPDNEKYPPPSDMIPPSREQLGYFIAPIDVTITYELDGIRWAWKGMITSYDGAGLNPVTRMMPCRITVDDPLDVKPLEEDSEAYKLTYENLNVKSPPPSLLSGMFVSITVHAKPGMSFFLAPEKAILPGDFIWIATDRVLKQHKVRVATTTSKGVLFYAESEDELHPEDLVVISPLAAPNDGDAVTLVHPEQTVR